MRGFLGMTGHFISNWKLESVMISCKRVRGRHTADKIRQEYEETLAISTRGKTIKNGASVQLSPYERKLLKELCYILKPFEDATIMVQKDKSVSASLVVLIYMGLTHQINELSVTYNNKLVQTLKLSLEKRLGGSMSDDNFLLAAMLDPTIKLRWCNSSDSMEMENKLLLNAKKYISSIHVDSESCDTDDSPPQKSLELTHQHQEFLVS
ncbi:Hypothetical predicted protein [Mytilus galloprovincialis]|nr:Hypothetical predicted protein [Mytilus galloprovincialis]